MKNKFAKAIGIPIEVILGRSRVRNIVIARSLYWRLERVVNNLTYEKIGAISGHSHSSVLPAIKKIEEDIYLKNFETIEAFKKVQHLFPHYYRL